MKHRARARLVFSKSSGMAQWCKNQLAVRHGQAVHINEGYKNEEPKYNINQEYDANNNEFKCDLPLLDKSHAEDAYNTLTDATIWAYLVDGVGVQFVEHHTCDHDETNRSGCVTQSKKTYGEPLE